MFNPYWNDNKTDNERYLEEELERERQWRRDEEEARQREREEQRRWRREQAQMDARTADNWREAVQKQAWLFEAEADEFDRESGSYFAEGAAACRRALELWNGEEAGVSEEIAKLEQRIQELKDSVRFNVGKKLEGERDTQGWRLTASELQDPDADFNRWLYW